MSSGILHYIIRWNVEFSWEGADEMDPVSGRGWAIIADGHLGRLYFHAGAESTIKTVIDLVSCQGYKVSVKAP